VSHTSSDHNHIIWVNGKPHRMRRGKLIHISDQWFGHVTRPQTIRKRQSKQIKKIKKHMQGDSQRQTYERWRCRSKAKYAIMD